MSQTIIAVFINLLATVLPLLGVNLGNEALTTTVQTVVAIITGLWIWTRRVQAGGVNVVGVRK